ncbi:MAG: hypothetical protein ACOCXZ_02830, partial [Chloroflexota bacterium]
PSTAAGSPFVNTAAVATPGDNNPANNMDAVSVDVNDISSQPDLAITKSHTDQFVVGLQRDFTLTVRNVGSGPTTGAITMTDTLPGGMTFVSGTGSGWTCGAAGQVVTCTNAGPLAPGAQTSITLTVDVGVGALGAQVNTASVSTPGDTNPANDSDSDNVDVLATGAPDLAIDKSHQGDFVQNNPDPYVYTLAVTNVGTEPVTTGPITVIDNVPAAFVTVDTTSGTGWDCAATVGNAVSCDYTGTLPVNPGAALPEISISVFADGPSAPGTFDNIATVSAPEDTNLANNSDTDLTVINGAGIFDPPFGFKTVDDNNLPVLQWGMIWLNPFNVTAFDVRVIDQIPAGTAYVPGSLSCTAFGASTVDRCEFDAANNRIIYEGSIAPDTGVFDVDLAANRVDIIFQTRVIGDPNQVTNTAIGYWDGDGDGAVEDDIAAGQQPGAQQQPGAVWQPAVTAFAAPGDPGGSSFALDVRKIGAADDDLSQMIRWLIVASNTGGAPGTDVVISDTLPASMRVDRVETDRGTVAVNGQTVTVNVGTLNPGESVEVNIYAEVVTLPDDLLLSNTAVVTGTGSDGATVTESIVAQFPVVTELPATGEARGWRAWIADVLRLFTPD